MDMDICASNGIQERECISKMHSTEQSEKLDLKKLTFIQTIQDKQLELNEKKINYLNELILNLANNLGEVTAQNNKLQMEVKALAEKISNFEKKCADSKQNSHQTNSESSVISVVFPEVPRVKITPEIQIKPKALSNHSNRTFIIRFTGYFTK